MFGNKQPAPQVVVETPAPLIDTSVVQAVWLSVIAVMVGAVWMSHLRSDGSVKGRVGPSPWARGSKLAWWPRDVYECAAINVFGTSPCNLVEIAWVLGCGYLYCFVV